MFFHLDDADKMLEKPNIDVGQLVNFVDGESTFECVTQVPRAF